MKRVGHIYEQMAVWENLVEAERVSTKRKQSNLGIRKHIHNRWNNLIEIQQHILNHTMRTGEYKHEFRRSGQNKLRDIAKLHFHPSHIQHQSLVLMSMRRVEKALIGRTYASRIGYGQIKAALAIRNFLRKHRGEDIWYAQCDIIKYYDNISHDLLRTNLSRLFKDKDFINAFMEPFERYSDTGKKIPLGIRPSQQAGNICLMTLDRFATEELKCKGYVRYLDDFVFFANSRWQIKWRVKRIEKHLYKEVPKTHRSLAYGM
ncbi:MAG: RNA-directed DNA polymerase [Bacteroidaceae bacterium]|nr:RNA-directed DNA polymerase [Bacteroidaceae bacterium]